MPQTGQDEGELVEKCQAQEKKKKKLLFIVSPLAIFIYNSMDVQSHVCNGYFTMASNVE